MTLDGLAEMIQRNVAMKEDLKGFATKEDIASLRSEMKEAIENAVQPLATKVDLSEYAKKSDLEKLSTKEDTTRIEAKIDGLVMREITPLKERVSKLEKQAKFASP